MAIIQPQDVMNLRRTFASGKLSVEGVAKAAIIKKEIVNGYIAGKPILNSFHFLAIKKTIALVCEDAKRIISEVNRHKALGENELVPLKLFCTRHEINLLQVLDNDFQVFEKVKEWCYNDKPFPMKYVSFITSSLLNFISEIDIK